MSGPAFGGLVLYPEGDDAGFVYLEDVEQHVNVSCSSDDNGSTSLSISFEDVDLFNDA